MIIVMMMIITGLFGDGFGLMNTARISLTLTHSKYENGEKRHSNAHGSWFMDHLNTFFFLPFFHPKLFDSFSQFSIFPVHLLKEGRDEKPELYWMRAYDEHHTDRNQGKKHNDTNFYICQAKHDLFNCLPFSYSPCTDVKTNTQKYWLISETRTWIECQKQQQKIPKHSRTPNCYLALWNDFHAIQPKIRVGIMYTKTKINIIMVMNVVHACQVGII